MNNVKSKNLNLYTHEFCVGLKLPETKRNNYINMTYNPR